MRLCCEEWLEPIYEVSENHSKGPVCSSSKCYTNSYAVSKRKNVYMLTFIALVDFYITQ